ncbi:MAG: FecR family protein [Draconibacterium sp.]|nr:FecR family protein [Draconibacterium sp.]
MIIKTQGMEENIKSLFISYLEKNISRQEEDFLIQWIKENPDFLKELNEIRMLWNLSEISGKIDNKHIANEWDLFLHKIEKGKSVQLKTKLGFMYWLPRVAAVFLLGAVISAAITYTIFSFDNSNLVYQEINTPAGSKSKITLPDGSSVWLNAGSSLRYSNQFGKKDREISLVGEAFFEVAKNRSKIFIVQAHDLSIKAYGTTFNVKSYPEENTVEATLIEGSIEVKRTGLNKNSKDEIILEPNQRVVYYKSSNKTEKIQAKEIESCPEKLQPGSDKKQLTYMISKGIDPVPFTSWKEGTLLISSETLAGLAVKLERKYDVKIHFENEALKQIKFSGSLKNETVEQVIEAIGIAAHIDYEIEEREIKFKEKN